MKYAMTLKQKIFCEEYLIDHCGQAAAIRAGYSTKAAAATATALLKQQKIVAYLDYLRADQSKRTGISADRVLEEIAKIAFVNMEDLADFERGGIRQDASKNDTSTIKAIKVKTNSAGETERELTLYDKVSALKLLAKHFGICAETVKFTGAVPVVIKEDVDE